MKKLMHLPVFAAFFGIGRAIVVRETVNRGFSFFFLICRTCVFGVRGNSSRMFLLKKKKKRKMRKKDIR